MIKAIFKWAAPLLVAAMECSAGDHLSGSLGVENRYFFNSPQFAGQLDNNSMELLVEPEFYWSGNSQRVGFKGFIRSGSDDPKRDHADIRELYWSYSGDQTDVVVGINKVYWGVVESWHLVDVINQVDLVESIYQDEKLGQPMVIVTLLRDWGTLSAFWLPGFRERIYPGVEGRNRSPLPVDNDEAVFLNTDKNANRDYAIRYSNYFGDVDLGVHWFSGLNREPELIANEDGTQLIPTYSEMRQLGADIQYTRNAWLWKLEAVANENDIEDYFATVAGLEYTFFQLFGGAADLGMLVEYLYDDRTQKLPLFNDDVFIGTRILLNDIQDTSLLVGAIIDRDTRETIGNVEFATRLGQQFTLEINATLFSKAEYSLSAFKEDSNVETTLKWHF